MTQPTIHVPDQPDNIDEQSRDLPDPQNAAARVRTYIEAAGDGLYDTIGTTPLYARDLEALTRAVIRSETAETAARSGCSCRASGSAAAVVLTPGGPKALRETLCVAQAAMGRVYTEQDQVSGHIARLQRLIDQLDEHRPLGPDGKHGDRHTATCGCDPAPGSERPVPADLEAIDTDLDEVRRNVDHGEAPHNPWALSALRAAEQLRGEVDRVEALRVELATELEDLQGEYAKTCSNFDEFAEGALETQQQLRVEAEQLRVERDGARAALVSAQTRIGFERTLAAQLRFLVAAVDVWQQRRRAGHQAHDETRTVQQQAAQARALLAQLDPDQPAPLLDCQTRGTNRQPICVRTYEQPPCDVCPDGHGDEVEAQVLYAGLPNLPLEPAVADELEADHA